MPITMVGIRGLYAGVAIAKLAAKTARSKKGGG